MEEKRFNIEVVVQQMPGAFQGKNELCITTIFRDHPVMMGEAVLGKVVELIAEKYVEENYGKVVEALTPADVLALVQGYAVKEIAKRIVEMEASRAKVRT